MALTSWDFSGADWESPDPRDSRYWHCLAQALKERTALCNAYRSTTYTLAYLDRLPYETTNLLTSFPVADFDATLRLVAAQYTDHRNISFETWLKATYNVDDQTAPTVATNKSNGNVELIKYEDEWWWTAIGVEDVLSKTSFFRPLWTWNSLCIDALSLTGEALATPPLQYSFLGHIDAASNWIATRYQIINMLRVIGFSAESLYSGFQKDCQTGNLSLRHKKYKQDCGRRVWNCNSYYMDYLGPQHFCNTTTWDDGDIDCSTCTRIISLDDTTSLTPANYQCYGDPLPSGKSFYQYSSITGIYNKTIAGGIYDGWYCNTSAINDADMYWLERSQIKLQINGNGKAKRRVLTVTSDTNGGTTTTTYDLWASIDVPYKSNRGYSWTTVDSKAIGGEPSTANPSTTTTVSTYSIGGGTGTYERITGSSSGFKSFATNGEQTYIDQTMFNSDPFTYWGGLLSVYGRVEGNDFNFKNW